MQTKNLTTMIAAALLTACTPTPPATVAIAEWDFTLDGDTTVQHVRTPHDWSINGPFAKDHPTGNPGGFLPTGKATYTTVVTPPDGLKDTDRIRLYFDGVYQGSTVYLNDKEVGGHHYGYFPYWVDVTDAFDRDATNTLKVMADNSWQPNGRWYTGSGIYRDVDMVITPEVEILPWSMQVLTPKGGKANADVNVNAVLANHSDRDSKSTLHFKIHDDGGNVVATAKKSVDVAAGAEQQVSETLTLDNPRIWDIDHPNLYTLEVTDNSGRQLAKTNFGVRTIEFTADKGFLLNGHPVDLNGGCVHHDNGVLGSRSFPTSEWMKARWMKDAGFNAVRTSHNPPSRHFLDACDQLGLVVIDEAFDGWRVNKNPGDYGNYFADHAADDVQRMVQRDRNHPSVIAWSIGNEILERKSQQAVDDAHMLVQAIQEYDKTRPVTQALAAWDPDWEIYDPLAAEHQVVGYNYMIHKHDSDHARVPERIMWQTESYPRDAYVNWDRTTAHDYIIGDFIWTGIDYLGESGIGRNYYEGQTPGESWENNQFPWHGAYCGDIDINGHLKPIGQYRQVLWHPADTTTVYLAIREPQGYKGQIHETMWSAYPTRNSWTWNGHEGKPIDIEVYSRAHQVTLTLNDSVIGRAYPSRDNQFKPTFTIPYRPGTLKVVTSSGSEQTLRTAGEPVALNLTKYPAPANAELDYYLVEAVDADGIAVPEADCRIAVAVDDPEAEILACANANLADSEPYVTPQCALWQGRALAVVRPGKKPCNLTATIKK